MLKLLIIIINQGNASKNDPEISPFLRWRRSTKWPTTNVGEVVRKEESFFTGDGILNQCNHYGNQWGDVSKKLKINLPYYQTISLLGICLKE